MHIHIHIHPEISLLPDEVDKMKYCSFSRYIHVYVGTPSRNLHALETPLVGQQGYGTTMMHSGSLNAGLLLHQGGLERVTIFPSLVVEQPPGPYTVDRTCGGMMASFMPERVSEESTFLYGLGSPACRPPCGLPPVCPPPALGCPAWLPAALLGCPPCHAGPGH